jgi:hypothetical protein
VLWAFMGCRLPYTDRTVSASRVRGLIPVYNRHVVADDDTPPLLVVPLAHGCRESHTQRVDALQRGYPGTDDGQRALNVRSAKREPERPDHDAEQDVPDHA